MRFLIHAAIFVWALPGARADVLSACKAYNGPLTEILWSGECINGLAQGMGAKVFKDKFNGQERDAISVDTYQNGKFTLDQPYVKRYYPDQKQVIYLKRDPSYPVVVHGIISHDQCQADPVCMRVDRFDVSSVAKAMRRVPAGGQGEPKSGGQEIDGFVFRVTKDQHGVPILETSGGPCATADAQVHRTWARLNDVRKYVKDGTWESSNHQVNAESVYNGIVLGFSMAPSTNYPGSLQYSKNSMNSVLSARSSSAGEKAMSRQGYSMTECIVRNHRHYVLAYRDWAKANPGKGRQ